MMKSLWRQQLSMVTIVFFAFTAASEASKTEFLTVDDVINLEWAEEFNISPNGDWVTWVKTTANEKKNNRNWDIYLSSLTENLTIQLTNNDQMDSSPKFSPDGRRIGFLGVRGEGSTRQIYVLALQGGEPMKITGVAAGIQSYEWLNDDSFIYTAREDSTFYERSLKQKKDDVIVVADQEHYPPVRLFKHDIKSKKISRLTANHGVISEFALSRDGKWVVTNENQDINFSYDNENPPKQFLIDLERVTRREICTAPHVDPYGFAWDARSEGFFCRRRVASDSTDTYVSISQLFYYDLSNERLRQVPLGWENGLGRQFYPVEDGVIATLADGTRDRLVHLVANKNLPQLLGTEKPVRLAAATANGKRIIYFTSRASTIPEVMTARIDGGQLRDVRKLIDINESLKEKTLSHSEVIRWAGAMGDTVEGVLYYPPDYDSAAVYPVVASIHGGPAGVDPDFFTERWSNYPHVLASKGMFVLKVNYHGSGNYGLDWVESIKGHFYEYEVPDIMTGIDHLVARGMVDEAKLGIMGWSNGSILAIACCIETGRFKVLCAGAGDINWTSDYGNCAFGAGFDNAYFGGPPWENIQTYIDKSPLFKMQKMNTPTLIMFGTDDTSVPTEQGWEHFRAMQMIGTTPVRFLLFPGAGHGLVKLSHRKRKMAEELAWIDRHLFATESEKNEALDEKSLLAYELKKANAKRVGYLVGEEIDATILPEIVELEGLRISRFEITRAQFGAFDPNYTYPAGTDNYPATEISLPLAQAYCLWLKERTGRGYRLPTDAEMEKLLTTAKSNLPHENNLERWVGYPPTPDEWEVLRKKIQELEQTRLLIEEVGSFPPVGDSGVYDLGGNVAEWVMDRHGNGQIKGLSAVSTRDDRVAYIRPPLSYVGFRVIER